MYFRRKTSAGRAYLQIVESRRTGEQVRQQVIVTLGRYEDLQASGQRERLLRSGARVAAKAMVLSAAGDDAAIKIAVRRIGPALGVERLWEETGCRAAIAELAGARGHKFALERAVLLTVLHRLFVSGSDRAADRWREDYAIAGVEGLDLHHLYRAMAWLGDELPAKEQDGRSPFARAPAGGRWAGPAARDPRGPARWRRAGGVLGDGAGQHRRRDDADPSDRPAAPALRHRARVRGRRPRHDQRRDHGRAGGAAALVYPRRARTQR